MAGQIVLRRPSMPLQRPKLMKESSTASTVTTMSSLSTPSRSARFADVAGGTTAACAVVCCCFPCGLVNLIVFAVVRLPAGLYRKAIKKQRRKKKIRRHLEQPKRYEEDAELQVDYLKLGEISPGWWPDKSPSVVVSEMENEMWTKLYGTGFWRNPSYREH